MSVEHTHHRVAGGLTRREMLARSAALVLTFPTAVLAACGESAAGPPKPVAISAADTCSRCGMLVSDLRQAAEILGTGGEVWKFDDLGELFAYRRERHMGDGDVRAMFVTDYRTRRWLQADRATYVISRGLRTPMGFGVAAFAETADARRFAARRDGRVLSYADVLRQPPRGNDG